MQKKFTSPCILMQSFLITTLILLISATPNLLFAQSFCANELVYFNETFGVGTIPSSNPDVITSVLTYQPNGELNNEGTYKVINNTFQKSDWHNSPDHTGNADGKMLVVNGVGNIFYSHTSNRSQGYTAGYYSSSLFLMNIDSIELCGPSMLKPIISFILEYQDENNNWVPLGGSPYTVKSVPISSKPTWVQLGGVFTLPTTGTYIVKNLRITLSDGNFSGCGNDYAIDDIKLASCPSGGPLPVEFLSTSAVQKGAGIAINWSTGSEINNKYFDVEKSIDGGNSWSLVATVKTAGNSSTNKSYNAYDYQPTAGTNYYRVKQVDIDGKSKYSSTVNVKVNMDKTKATVLSNPIINNISIDFLSKENQAVYLSLSDVTGKRITTERLVIQKGSSRKTLDQVANLQKGVYILNIGDDNGTSIYNGKLVKQ